MSESRERSTSGFGIAAAVQLPFTNVYPKPNYELDVTGSIISISKPELEQQNQIPAQEPATSILFIKCPRCSELVVPQPFKMPSLATHVLVGFLGVIGLAGLMFLPYLCNLFSKPAKRCTDCGTFLYYEEEKHI